MVSAGELWSTLFVPQRMKMQLNIAFEGISRFSILRNKFLILSPWIPKFNVLCLEKYSDQRSWYLLMFHIKKPPINKLCQGESFSEKCCYQNFSYQTSLLFLGIGIKCFDNPITDINYVTIVSILIFVICSH